MASDLDMYADDFDSKEKEKLVQTTHSSQEDSEEQVTGTIILKPLRHYKVNSIVCIMLLFFFFLGESLQWEYKFSLESNEVFGPYKTEQMQKWKVDDKFKEPIWVRKCNSNSEFHSFKRVDFELYL